MGGAHFSLDELNEQGLPCGPVERGGARSPGQQREAGHAAEGRQAPGRPADVEKEREEEALEENARIPVSNEGVKDRGRRTQLLRRADGLDETSDRIVFDRIELEAASKKAIDELDEDEDVVVLMPANEFVIAHGPKRTVLFLVCRSVSMTKKINGFLEGEPLLSEGSSIPQQCSLKRQLFLIQHRHDPHDRGQGTLCMALLLRGACSSGNGRGAAI